MKRQNHPHRHHGPGSRTSLSPSVAVQNVRQSLDDAFSGTKSLLRAWEDLKERNDHQAFELQEKQAYIDRLEKELDESRSQIFRSLNVFKVSDFWISERLDDIYQVLFNWITQLPHSTQFSRHWPKAQAFLNAKGYGGSSEFEIDIDAETMDHLKFEFMTFHIFHILWEHLFSPLWPGVDESTKNTLEQLHQRMDKLDPKIDSQDIEIWRSNTFRAHAGSVQYQQQVKATCDRAADMIIGFASNFRFTEDVDWSNMARRLGKQVLTPAASLAAQLRSSREKYQWESYNKPRKRLQKNILEKYDIVDSITHCQVRNTKFQDFTNSEVVGTLVLPMYPAILRIDKDDINAPHVARKGWIVVAVESPKVKSEDTWSPVVTSPVNHEQQIKKEPSPSPSVSIQSMPSTTNTTGSTTKTDDDKKFVPGRWPWS